LKPLLAWSNSPPDEIKFHLHRASRKQAALVPELSSAKEEKEEDSGYGNKSRPHSVA